MSDGEMRIAVRRWSVIGWEWQVQSYASPTEGGTVADPWFIEAGGWSLTRANAVSLARRSRRRIQTTRPDGEWEIVADDTDGEGATVSGAFHPPFPIKGTFPPEEPGAGY